MWLPVVLVFLINSDLSGRIDDEIIPSEENLWDNPLLIQMNEQAGFFFYQLAFITVLLLHLKPANVIYFFYGLT